MRIKPGSACAIGIVAPVGFWFNRASVDLTPKMSAAAKRLAGASRRSGSLGDLRREFGFKAGASGAHLARTMMLADLTALLAAAPKTAKREEFNRLIVEDNVLGKRTTSNRWLTARHLTEASHGQGSFDSARFTFNFWELLSVTHGWVPQQSTPSQTQYFGGCHFAFRWEDGQGELAQMMEAKREHGYSSGKWKAGVAAWGKQGLLVGQMSDLPCTFYMGAAFDENASVVIPHNPGHLLALWAYCTSETFRVALREIDQSIKITCKTLVKVPFDLAHWQRVAAEKYPKGLPNPDSNDLTQWLFNGRLADSTAPMQVGVARLLGYRWPRQTGQTVSGAAPVAEDGLEGFTDEDGIVCVPSVRGEIAGPERLRALLAAAYGEAWTAGKLDELLSTVGYAGSNLEDWLRNGFFEQHSKLFHHRPFIWQIWDGRKDGFSALVNYHKLDHRLLEELTYTYLGDWIKKQQKAVGNEESGADDRLLKAQQLQGKLKLILEGEAPYDIFVRWKPLEQQPIGWHPDLNDGARLNIRPFMTADVFRKRPSIKWGKDRGKNPPSSPWGEVRDNDRHLTLDEKQVARRT
jgi:hypothetical protein